MKIKDRLSGLIAALLLCALPLPVMAENIPSETGVTRALVPDAIEPCKNLQTNLALDLYNVVNIALCNNPQTHEAWANAQSAAAQIGVTRASYLPNISITASGNQNSPGNTQRSIGLSLSYLLYDFGARAANLENARQLLIAMNATQDSTIQSLFLSAVQTYYQAHATQAVLDASAISEEAAKVSFLSAQARYQAGSATPADKFSAATAYAQATLTRITAGGAMKIARGNLSNLLGLDANLPVSLMPPTALPQPEKVRELEANVSSLIEQARFNRPDLVAAKAQLDAAKATADAARAAAQPSISATASSNQSNSAGITTHGATLGLSITAPIFSGYAPTYRIKAAEAQIETKQAQYDKLRLQVALDVWTGYQNLLTAGQNLNTTAELLKSAEQSERMALGRYKAGAGLMLDLLNAQTALASARQQRIQAEFNWNTGRAVLAQAMGKLNAPLLFSDKQDEAPP